MSDGDVLLILGVLLLAAFMIGAVVGFGYSSEADALDRFCTHQSPSLGYNALPNEQIGFGEDGRLQVTCTGDDGEERVYVLDANRTPIGGDIR